MTRTIALGFAAAAVTVIANGSTAGAGYYRDSLLWHYYDGPWCFRAATDDIYECGYATLEQCNITRSGVGGSCTPNPRYVYVDPREPRRKVRRHYR